MRGAGRAFCSGIDLTALSQGEISLTFFRNWEAALRKLETLDAIVIAAVQSHCIGGGLQVALACDLRIARDDARFGITAVRERASSRASACGGSLAMPDWAEPSGLRWPRRSSMPAVAQDWGLVDWVVDADVVRDDESPRSPTGCCRWPRPRRG